MLLHRYFVSHALETLKTAELKTSRLSTFNDPFEFMYVYNGTITHAKANEVCLALLNTPGCLSGVRKHNPNLTDDAIHDLIQKNWPSMMQQLAENFKPITEMPLEQRKQIIDEDLRAICFSDPSRMKPSDEVLMWTHYASKHEGVRIGFEFPDGIKDPFEIKPINYQQNRVEVDFSFGAKPEPVLSALEKSATVKSLSWQYEQEYRLFVNKGRCENRKMPDSTVEQFFGFKRDWVKSVDFGVSCPETTIKPIVDLIKSAYLRIIPKKAVFHETEYAFTYNEI